VLTQVGDPQSQVLYPNGRASKDARNNVEKVWVMDAVPGSVYQVKVSAPSVTIGGALGLHDGFLHD
jgi:hypothetical protein